MLLSDNIYPLQAVCSPQRSLSVMDSYDRIEWKFQHAALDSSSDIAPSTCVESGWVLYSSCSVCMYCMYVHCIRMDGRSFLLE
jgi:hypothetical protein